MEFQYEVVDHGIEYPQYFQGCGTSFTDYDWCVTGIGDDFNEALDDALENVSQVTPSDFKFADFDNLVVKENLRSKKESQLSSVSRIYTFELANDEEVDMYYHVSIRFNIDKKRKTSERTEIKSNE